MADEPISIAVIGGSGLYNMPQLTDIEERQIDTPFGPTSDAIIVGTLNNVRVAFLSRHGRGHVYSPSEVPYRANIYALKTLGVERVISVSACGSLREDYAPGHIVVPDQLYDHTKGTRARTFFENGIVGHIGVPSPFCSGLSETLTEGASLGGGTVDRGGTFITIEGPRFSTRAESNVYRSWGMSIIGMTTSPEAYLAREAEMCYAVMAHVTDYDVWHESAEPVTVDMVVRTFNANLEVARRTLFNMMPVLARTERTCDCGHALADAIITDRRKVSDEVIRRLEPIIGKYFA
jgi:5'-methylthioadenosine phosphorylase